MGERLESMKLWLMEHLCCCCYQPDVYESDEVTTQRDSLLSNPSEPPMSAEEYTRLMKEMSANDDAANRLAAAASARPESQAEKDTKTKLGAACARVDIDQAVAEDWARVFGEAPEDSVDKLLNGLDYIGSESIDLDLKSKGGDLEIGLRAKRPEAGPLPEAGSWLRQDCEVTLTAKIVTGEDPYFYIDRLDTRQGNCAPFFLNLMDMWEAMKLKKVKLQATDDGRYVWIRYGFRPDNESWSKLRNDAGGTLERLSKKYDIPPDIVERAEQMLGNGDPEAITGFTDLTFVVGGTKLGILLAKSSMWNGELDLTNADLVAQVRTYLDR